MPQVDVLVPLNEIAVDPADLLPIKRNELVPLLNDQYRLNHYADARIMPIDVGNPASCMAITPTESA